MRRTASLPLFSLLVLQLAGCGAFRSHPDLTPSESVLSVVIQANTKAKVVAAALSDLMTDAKLAGEITDQQFLAFDERITRVEDVLLELGDSYDAGADSRERLLGAIRELAKLAGASEIVLGRLSPLIDLALFELDQQMRRIE